MLSSLKSQVVLLQTAHSWANAGVLLGARMHRERVAMSFGISLKFFILCGKLIVCDVIWHLPQVF